MTGITLPLMSYGGSSMLSVMLGIGLLVNIGMRWHITLFVEIDCELTMAKQEPYSGWTISSWSAEYAADLAQWLAKETPGQALSGTSEAPSSFFAS